MPRLLASRVITSVIEKSSLLCYNLFLRTYLPRDNVNLYTRIVADQSGTRNEITSEVDRRQSRRANHIKITRVIFSNSVSGSIRQFFRDDRNR